VILFDGKYRTFEFGTGFTGTANPNANYSLQEVITANIGADVWSKCIGVVLIAKTGKLSINLLGILIPSGGQTNVVLSANVGGVISDSAYLTLYSKELLNKVNIARGDVSTEVVILCLCSTFV